MNSKFGKALQVVSLSAVLTTVDARRSHSAQVAPPQQAYSPPPTYAPPQPAHAQKDPFADLFAPSPKQPSRGGGGSSYQAPSHSPAYQPQPAAPVVPAKKDDGADQDEENDPQWYKGHAMSYPCYKLAEQGLFNFEQMRNLDGDWEVTDTRGRQVKFNFCVYAESTSNGCEHDSFAFMKEGTKCLELTSDEPKGDVNLYVERSSQIKTGDTQEGIRMERGGGAACDSDPSSPLAVTIDVWCNPDIKDSPQQITSEAKGPLDDDEADPCNIYISMEHANGCVVFDLQPFLAVIGGFMMMSGICLQYMGPKWQQSFMVFIVRLGTFLIICHFAYERNYFAFADPSEPPEKKDPLKFFFALIFAFLAQWIVGFLFRYSIRLAPTLLGIYIGYYFSIYIIVAINGLGGVFASAKAAKDTIDPLMAVVYELVGAFFGGILGYCYSYAFIAVVQTFLSAYLIVRGSTLFKNWGFPNEIILMSSTTSEQNGAMTLPPAFYVYSFVIFVLWIIFLRSHMRRRYAEEENRKYLDEEV